MTSIEAVEIVYQHLKNSVLFTDAKKPNGSLNKYQRPAGSGLEDVVVNSIVMGRAAVQRGVLNVNVYVPNLELPGNSNIDRSQPDYIRLTELAKLTELALPETDIKIPGRNELVTFEIQQDTGPYEDNGQHFLNFRIDFRTLNISEH